MSTANVTQTGQAATVSVTVSRGLPGATGATGAPGTTDYNELDNVPTEFPPSAHTHPVSDIVSIASGRLLGRHAGGSGAGQEVTVGNGLEFQGSGIRRSALTGDVTASAGSNTTTLANTAVTPAEYTAPTITVDAKGRITAAESVTYETPAGVDAKIAAANLLKADIDGGNITDPDSFKDNLEIPEYQIAIASADVGPRITATPADDTELQVQVAANATYLLRYQATATSFNDFSVGGFRIAFAGPAISSMYLRHSKDAMASATAAVFGQHAGQATTALATGIAQLFTSAGTTQTYMFEGSGLITFGGTGGTLKMQWAQFASGGTGATRKSGSYLELIKL